MSFTNHRHSASVEGVYYDEGLRSYMVRVFNYMAIALGITGVTAYFVSSSASLLDPTIKIDFGSFFGKSITLKNM